MPLPALSLPIPPLRAPGIFVTGTDTGVGKTLVSCAIAAALRDQLPSARIGVCKPFATGCRKEREGLISEDAELLAWSADSRLPLDVINPIRFVPPLAPAVAAEQTGTDVDWAELARALAMIDASSDAVVIEGVGGLMVPLDPAHPRLTVLDLAHALAYPVVVVARSVLGTLSHTAMTVKLLHDRGCRVAGIVMNGYDADVATHEDPSVASNRAWLERLTGVRVLSVVPRVKHEKRQTPQGRINLEVIDTVALTYWPDVLRPPGR